jgi:hypothetical protein
MAKDDAGPHLQQLSSFGCIRRRNPDPKPFCCPPQYDRVSNRVRGGEQQQPLGLGRQLAEPLLKRLFDPPGEGE